MSLDNVTPGSKVPEQFNVIIEIPMNADPVKYEVDKATGAIFVDRFMSTAMHYPTNYGYVPKPSVATVTPSMCWSSRLCP
jgi:inorganic pyrophosphatase